MHYLIILLIVIALLLGKKKTTESITVNVVPNVPPDFRNAAQLDFADSPYQNRENWIAVSKMETAGWTSKLYREANNPWGMTYPSKRPTRANGKMVGTSGKTSAMDWATYEDLDDAVADIILWMDYTKFPTEKLSLRDHVEEMGKRGYYGQQSSDSYYKLVAAWLNR